MKIKILHWNIWYKEKVENVLKVIESVDADVLLLQEVTDGCEYNDGLDVAKVIGEKTGMNYNFALAHKYDEHSQGNVIFSKFPIVSNSNFFIAEANEGGGYSDEARSCAVSKIDLGAKKLNLATAHSSYYHKFADGEKLNEAKRLVDFFKGKENLVFSGDLNSIPGSDFIGLIESELEHCGPDYKEATWTTKPFSYGGFEEDKLIWRLDYVFASRDVKVISSEILETEYSDHLPILVEIEI